MARERYLVGVSKEELEYHSFATPPTPKSRWEDFWYHHKWKVLGIALTVVIVAGLIIHSVTRVRPDVLICMVSKTAVAPSVVEQLQEEFAACATDVNGDGNVLVTVQVLDISANQSQQSQTVNHQSILGHLAAKDVHLFVFDPAYYTQTVCGAMKDGVTFFEKLDVTAPDLSSDGTYWNWKNADFLKKEIFVTAANKQQFPASMVCGVRAADEKTYSDKQKAAQQACVALLKAFIEKQV